ncbi:MAG: LTA synthase family protein [Clostridiales bacterium]|nr:LTA synthase family protein [Clostridiales bacterium]
MEKQRILHVQYGTKIAFAIFILFFLGCRLLHPFYLSLLEENINLEICATSEHNEEALSNNVRLKKISVNGTDVNLGKAELPEGWSYLSIDDFIYIYNLEEASSFEIQLTGVRTLELTFVGEVGSGIIDIYFNGELWREEDLYRDAEWEEITWTYESSIWVLPEKHVFLIAGALLLACIISFIIICVSGTDKLACYSQISMKIIELFLLACIILLFSEVIQYQGITEAWNHMTSQLDPVLKSLVLMFLLNGLVYFMSGKIWISYTVVTAVMLALNIVSLIKLENRNVPLLPWDFSLISEAMSIQSSYDISLNAIEIIILALAVAILLFLIWRYKKEHIKWTFRLLNGFTLLVLLLIYVEFGFINGNLDQSVTINRTYEVNSYYTKRGFLTAFVEYFCYLEPSDEPDTYSKQTMESLISTVDEMTSEDTDSSGNQPSIIVIMSESFWDISRLESLDFEEESLPVYGSLKEESMYGELLSHVYGGGTVTSEFEFLTGFSGEFFPTDYMVYGNFLTSGFTSAVSILESQGYATMAFHPYVATNYNREAAYELFGFDKTFFADDFTDEVKMVRNYISDESLFDKMIEEYESSKAESDQPLFLFAVTMQNHGGYWESSIYEEGLVDFTSDVYQDTTMLSIEDYVAGLHESDRALGELIEYFRDVDEDVIVIFFGDHMSDAGPKDEKLLDKAQWTESDSITQDYENHLVPFIVWSNFSNESQDAGVMEISMLFPTVLETYGIEKTAFWDFLVELKSVYAATDSMIVVNQDGTYASIDEMTEIQQEYYENYRLLQYDYIFGNQYARSLWE